MNNVKRFMNANKDCTVISGAVLHHGGGCYVLQNGARYDWSKEDMESFIEAGGIFEPVWKITAG